MDIIERKQCIFCDNPNMELMFSKDLSFPVFAGVTNNERTEDDIKAPYNVQFCSQCSAAQIKYLIPLDILYKTSHNQLVGSIWVEHHDMFAKFIKTSISINPEILEIGAGNMHLAKILSTGNSWSYTSLDLKPPPEVNPRFKSLVSSIEDVKSLDEFDTIIMSHVFEHLYKPKEVIEKLCSISSIKNVYISIPNFLSYIRKSNYNALHVEHTFYVDSKMLSAMFLNSGFSLVSSQEYSDHSIFYHFSRSEEQLDCTDIQSSISRQELNAYFDTLRNNAERFNFFLKEEKESYIFPCHIYIQYLSIFGLDLSLISGIVDNNPDKIGKRLYGTNLQCFDLKKIIHATMNRSIMIILAGGIYNTEIESYFRHVGFSNYITHLNQSRRIALCLNGQPRFYQKGFQHLKNILYRRYFVDTFCHFWWDENSNEKYEVAPWSEIITPLYPDKEARNYIERYYVPKILKTDPSRKFVNDGVYRNTNSVSAPNNLFSKCYSQLESIQLKQEYEKLHGFTYDIVIITRYDILFYPEDIGLDLNTLDTSYIYNPRDDIHYYKENTLVSDHFFVSSSENSDKIGSIYEFLDGYYQEGIFMNAEQMFTRHFDHQKIKDRFVKYTVPSIQYFRG